MKVIRIKQLAPLLLAVFGIGPVTGQPDARPLLPFEDAGGAITPSLNDNSFGRPTGVRAIHNESVATPDFGQIQLDPQLPGPPRYYIYIRYYACRPWFIHPYTGQQLTANDLFTNIQSNNNEWPGQGLPLDELTDPARWQDSIGEPLVVIDSPAPPGTPLGLQGLVHESNPDVAQCSIDEQEVEIQNAANVGVQLPSPQPIWHRPYYGLYCLRVRICVPHVTTQPGRVWNFWPKWRYRVHQRYCWRTWWHYCWFNHPTRLWIRYPWRPMCTPCVWWHRAGPDWIVNICNVNRYRHWCLYGLRYYCTFYGSIVARNPSPRIASLLPGLQPPGGVITTDWLRPWPYPRIRYWPFRPYCTRWYWFRPLPWINYRYLPPVLNASVAIPDAENGAGFVPTLPTAEQVRLGADQFPLDPPKLDANGNFENQATPDSFFDIFVDAGECRWRALEEQIGDTDGNGGVGTSDFNRRTQFEAQLENATDDLSDPGVRDPGLPN